MLCPKSPDPVLLVVLVLPLPKENELALVAVEAPKSPAPPVVAPLEPPPKADWVKEKLLGDPAPLAGWPKPLLPNTELLKLAVVEVPNPVEPNPVAEGAEEAGSAAGCPKTALAAVVVDGVTVAGEVVAGVVVVGVVVVGVGATVLITGMAPMELLSVVAG